MAKQKPIEYYVNENGCHICTSHSKDKQGYIKISRDGFWRLHRWLYWKNTGEKPEVVMHTCDNPSCINMEHLKAGAQKENVQDIFSKNRRCMKGENNPANKLMESDIKRIRTLYETGKYSYNDIGLMYNITRQNVYRICKRLNWIEVE